MSDTSPGGAATPNTELPSAEPLDVGLIPAECPGTNGTGATFTSSLVIQRLSRHHDLTVYVASQTDASDPGVSLPATDRVDYVLHDDLDSLPHPLWEKLDAARSEQAALARHDVVHAHSPAFIPVVAELDVPTLVTLNSYFPVCPKGDMVYRGEEKCSGPARAKCVGCIASADLDPRQGVENSLRATYSSMGKLGFVHDCIENASSITAYHAVSPHIKSDYAALGFPEDRIEVIPHFYEESFRDLGGSGTIDDGPLDLLYVGALKDSKGLKVLLRAIPILRRRDRDVRLRVAGSGPYEESLHAMATRLGIDDHVEWLGHVDHAELPGVYRDSDVFVYPGLLDEPFGRVLLEALETGTPVAASDVGSTDFITGDGGVRFEPENEIALADAVEEVVENYGRYREAIPDHLERFEPERIENELLALYDSVATESVLASPDAV